MITTTEITEEAWLERFKPVKNDLDLNAGWNQTMFETFGPEIEFVISQPDENIWTLVEGDSGTYVVSGRHWVNRLGYFICQTPVPDGEYFEIVIDEPEEYCEECSVLLEDCECEEEASE